MAAREHRLTRRALLVAAAAMAAAACSPQAESTASPTGSSTASDSDLSFVTVQEVKKLIDSKSNPLIFDARSKTSYGAGHLPGARSLPLAELEARVAEVPRDRQAIFYCTGAT